MNKKILTYLAYIIAVVFVVLAFIYFTTPANQLPHFLPGYSDSLTKTHAKHGIASAFLALACVAYAWFQGGPKSSSGSAKQEED